MADSAGSQDAPTNHDVVKGADIGMIQRRDGAGFTLEPLTEPRARNLDRHTPVQARIAGPVDFAHAAGADRRHDLVGADELGSGGDSFLYECLPVQHNCDR